MTVQALREEPLGMTVQALWEELPDMTVQALREELPGRTALALEILGTVVQLQEIQGIAGLQLGIRGTAGLVLVQGILDTADLDLVLALALLQGILDIADLDQGILGTADQENLVVQGLQGFGLPRGYSSSGSVFAGWLHFLGQIKHHRAKSRQTFFDGSRSHKQKVRGKTQHRLRSSTDIKGALSAERRVAARPAMPHLSRLSSQNLQHTQNVNTRHPSC